MFAENEQLGIGEKTGWGGGAKRWFPKALTTVDDENEGRSFSSLIVKLNELGDVLRAAKVEDLMGGMSVG